MPVDPLAVAVADFDRDGLLDLVGVNPIGQIEIVTGVHLAALTGVTLTPVSMTADLEIATPVVSGASIAVADFNGDGAPDIAIVRHPPVGHVATILLNAAIAPTATPAFHPLMDFVVSAAPLHIAAADLNGDGLPDLAIQCQGDAATPAAVSILLNTTQLGASACSFVRQDIVNGEPTRLGYNNSPLIALGDINADTRPDIVAAPPLSRERDRILTVFVNTTSSGSPSVTFTAMEVPSLNPLAATIADIDADGRGDIVLSGEVWPYSPSGYTPIVTQVYLSSGTPAAPTFTAGPLLAPMGYLEVAVADMDGDGRLDIVSSRGEVAYGTATGIPPAFAAPIQLPGKGRGLAIADLNADGRLDVVFGAGLVFQVVYGQ